MVDPAVELIEQGGVEFACFDLLAELTVALLTRAKMRDPGKGYVPDVEPILRQALPAARRNEVGIVTNGVERTRLAQPWPPRGWPVTPDIPTPVSEPLRATT